MSIAITADVLDGCVLSLLTQEDAYGYALTQRVQTTLPVSESTMYPVLRRLKQAGLVETYDQPYQGRNRRYYRITAPGVAHLTDLRQQWRRYKNSIDQLMEGSAHD